MDRIAVYTAVFGGYEGLVRQPRIEGVDFLCFADRPIRAHGWEVRVVEFEEADPVRAARKRKILAHRYLSGYTTSIWMDGNYLVAGDIRGLAERALARADMAVFSHARTRSDPRDCVYDEYEAMMRMGRETGRWKDDPDVMTAQIERYRREGYPERHGLIFSAVLLRRHGRPDVVRTMERWWEELSRGSRRDQLSFDYAAWKEGLAVETIDGDLRNNPWFHMLAHHRRSYAASLLRYRLRRLLGIVRHR
ncbi:MAG: DUF616 domain-containing protein [Candidatus Krumholzibacteriota bacterium]|nr:DUF616 domain-containing protein [Candidatus Krumholzibacteriota bacterium]